MHGTLLTAGRSDEDDTMTVEMRAQHDSTGRYALIVRMSVNQQKRLHGDRRPDRTKNCSRVIAKISMACNRIMRSFRPLRGDGGPRT